MQTQTEKKIIEHNLKFYLTFQRSAQTFEDWQKKVFKKIRKSLLVIDY
jgi:hypothetical protein